MKEEKTIPPVSVPSESKAEEASVNGTPPIQYISRQRHLEIKRKVLTVHDGLLRRLAEHDRRS